MHGCNRRAWPQLMRTTYRPRQNSSNQLQRHPRALLYHNHVDRYCSAFKSLPPPESRSKMPMGSPPIQRMTSTCRMLPQLLCSANENHYLVQPTAKRSFPFFIQHPVALFPIIQPPSFAYSVSSSTRPASQQARFPTIFQRPKLGLH